MEALQEIIDLKNLNKSNWKSFCFEEIASKISETVDPNNTNLKVYVGLEHIDAEDIHIKRFGTPEDVSGGKLKCYPGDVIFGKRRAYQRKAAIVDFEGICSAHAFVFRANSKVIDPRLFPFFLHSDQFMHRMVDISVGGLSPTINWGDLKHQAFFVPPKYQQAKLAELLWAMDKVIESDEKVLRSLRQNIDRYLLDNFNFTKDDEINGQLNGDPFVKLKDISIIKGRIGWRGYTVEDLRNDGPLVIGAKDIDKENKFDFKEATYISEEKYLESPEIMVSEKDIILVKTGNTIGKVAIVDFKVDKATINPNVVLIKPKGIIPKYLYYFLVSQKGQSKIASRIFTTAQPAINQENINAISLPLKTENKQIEIVSKIESLEISMNVLISKISSSKALQKSLINQIF
ncbi:restriction endonuclease subunit S [Chitinophagaceae bacterium 26-R-25]|nr:restriction endonuclease subunit S [Chitinophagaceae bacterium 26-R-25]